MKIFTLIFLAAALSTSAQVVSPFRALRPIMKDPNNRQAPSSVSNRDLNDGQDPQQAPAPGAAPAAASPATLAAAPAKPAVIVAKIDSGLSPSPVTLLGRVEGIKGTIYVTNRGADMVAPHVQFAVCDGKGILLGTVAKIGEAISSGDVAKIVVTATNGGATDLKLMKLSVK